MGAKIVKCKTCNGDMASNAKVCPNCGAKNKKPIYKKWWLWAIVVVIIASVFVFGGDDSNQQPSSNNQTSQGTSSNGKNDSSVVDLYKTFSENDIAFTINESAIKFMNEHKNFFPGNSEIKGQISDYVNKEVTYAHLNKNVSKYTDKLIAIYGTVTQIEESKIDGKPFTRLNVFDYDDNCYTMYYLGTLDDVFEDSEIYGYALPLDKTTFENQAASYTETIICAASYIELDG